jgi:RNA polymerase sigma-70 factor (ECF subfamily)
LIQKSGKPSPMGGVQVRQAETLEARPDAPAVSQLDFDEIFETCSGFVWCVLAKLGVPSADVPDVCQEVFVVVHRRLGDFDGRTSIRSWIYGICVRTASHFRRRKRSRKENSVYPVPETPVAARQDEELHHRRAKKFLDAVLDELGEDKRAVFVLYELEELTMSEVAEALGCPLQTAYSRLYTARTAVTNAFRRFGAKGSAR